MPARRATTFRAHPRHRSRDRREEVGVVGGKDLIHVF
jgi:hypothetical protein